MLSQLRQDTEDYIQSLALSTKKPERLYAPMHYILSLKGKRIRPLLAMLAYHSVSGKAPQQALSLSVGVELFHNFSLIHDDIMDNSPTRRGKSTVHEKWDVNVGILSGDAMFALAMQLITKDFPEQAARLSEIFTQAALEVCEGQMEDMDFPLREQVSIPEYIEMIRKKTSVLLGAALKLGAVAGGASAELAEAYYRFGEAAGIGFQLQDDLMDAFPPEGFGKQIGGDIIENKQTFLLLKSLELADAKQSQQLRHALESEPDNEKKVAGVLAIYQDLAIPSQTQQLIKSYFDQAEQTLAYIGTQADTSTLQHLLKEIFMRKV